jgi:putative inorganic carbon (hco3(-)) transporter
MRSFAVDWVGVALVAVGGTLAAGLFLVIALTNPSTLQVVGLAAAFAVAVIGAACIVTNFFSVVLFFIFCRITLDGLKTGGSAGASFLDPATLVGAAFILASVLWLLGQALSGQYRPASTVTKLFYGLVAWSFASALVSELPMEALTASAKLLAGVLMLGVLEQLLPGRPDRVKQLLASVLGSAVIPMLVGCYQALTGSGDTSSTPGFNRVLGTAVTPVAFASYLIIIAIVVAGLLGAQRRYRLPLSLFGMVTLLLIYWTFTRSAWLVTAVGIVLVFARVNRVLLIIAGCGLTVVPFINPEVAARFQDLTNHTSNLNPYASDDAANSLLWRFDYWGQIIDLSEHRRWTGVGLDCVQLLTQLGLKPHNIFVQGYVELGIVGVAIMTAAFVAVALHLYARRKTATTTLEKLTATIAVVVALCTFVESLTTNPLTSTMIWWYFAAAMTFGFATPTRQPDLKRMTTSKTLSQRRDDRTALLESAQS